MFSSPEPLEARIAPAAITGKVLTYTDIDGDKVAITFTKGTLIATDFTFDTGTVDGHTTVHQQLELIDIDGDSTSVFEGTSITEKVTREPGGDGLAAIGRISASGVNLGKVTIAGDLGSITASSGANSGPAIAGLVVNSLGRYGLRTQAAGGTLVSSLPGGLSFLTVSHDVAGAFVNVAGNLGPVTIGGSLVGGAADHAGEISASGNIGKVVIGGDLVGGAGAEAGYLFSGAAIAGITVGGSLLGGSGENTGSLEARGNIGPISIGHDVLGGTGEESGYVSTDSGTISLLHIFGSIIGGAGNSSGCAVAGEGGASGSIAAVIIGHDIQGGGGVVSGYVQVSGNLGNVSVGGSVIGGPAGETGGIISFGRLGAVTVGHNVQGGAGAQSGYIEAIGQIKSVIIGGSLIGGTANETGEITTGEEAVGDDADMGPIIIRHNLVGGGISGTQGNLTDSGIVLGNGQIASVTIGGSVIAGVNTSSKGVLDGCGSIRADYDIPLLKVGGSLIGNEANPVVISATGQETGVNARGQDSAFGIILIGQRVEWSQILAGYDPGLTAEDGNAQIGTISVGRDWIASTVVAGIESSGGVTQLGKAATDEVIPPTMPANSVAHLAKVVIGGSVIGDASSTNGTDAFGFVSFTIGSLTIHGVHETAPNSNLAPLTGDVAAVAQGNGPTA